VVSIGLDHEENAESGASLSEKRSERSLIQQKAAVTFCSGSDRQGNYRRHHRIPTEQNISANQRAPMVSGSD
jgi:hypothetical protein